MSITYILLFATKKETELSQLILFEGGWQSGELLDILHISHTRFVLVIKTSQHIGIIKKMVF